MRCGDPWQDYESNAGHGWATGQPDRSPLAPRESEPPGQPGLTWSAVLEVGLALLDERGNAFLLVFGREQRVKRAALEQDALGKRRFECAIDRFLGRHDRGQREPGDLPRRRERLIQERRPRHDAR